MKTYYQLPDVSEEWQRYGEECKRIRKQFDEAMAAARKKYEEEWQQASQRKGEK